MGEFDPEAFINETLGGSASTEDPFEGVDTDSLLMAYLRGEVADNGRKPTEATVISSLKARGFTAAQINQALEDVKAAKLPTKGLSDVFETGVERAEAGVEKRTKTLETEVEKAAKYTGPSEADIKKLVAAGKMDMPEAQSLLQQIYRDRDPRLIELAMEGLAPATKAVDAQRDESPADFFRRTFSGVKTQESPLGISEGPRDRVLPINFGDEFGGEQTISFNPTGQLNASQYDDPRDNIAQGNLGFSTYGSSNDVLGLGAKSPAEEAAMTLAFYNYSNKRQGEGATALMAAEEFKNQYAGAGTPYGATLGPRTDTAPGSPPMTDNPAFTTDPWADPWANRDIIGYAGGGKALLPERTWLVGDSGKVYGVAAEEGEKEYVEGKDGGLKFTPTNQDITLGRESEDEPDNIMKFATGGYINDIGRYPTPAERAEGWEYGGSGSVPYNTQTGQTVPYSSPGVSAYQQMQQFAKPDYSKWLDGGQQVYNDALHSFHNTASATELWDAIQSGAVTGSTAGTRPPGSGLSTRAISGSGSSSSGGSSTAGMTPQERAYYAAQQKLVDAQRRNLGLEQADFDRLMAAQNDTAGNAESAAQQHARDMFGYRWDMTGLPLPEEINPPLEGEAPELPQPGVRYAIESPEQRVKRQISVSDMQRQFEEKGLRLDADSARILASLANAEASGSGGSSGGSSSGSTSKVTTQKQVAANYAPPAAAPMPAPVGEFEAINYVPGSPGEVYSVDLPGSMGPVDASWVRMMARERGIEHLLTGDLIQDTKLVIANWNNFQNKRVA